MELYSPRTFKSDSEAEDWTKAYISSWYDWILEIDYGDK